MKNNNFYESLKHYFDTTPREKVLEDWAKSVEHDKIGVTVEKFLDNTNQKETLEETAKRIYGSDASKDVEYYAFILGAKWMQDRMYSEEEMREAFIAGGNSLIEEDDDYGTEYDAYMEQWFEQFKNK
jgi:hypothetical protein